MTEFIKSPNLPQRKVKKIICGTKDDKILSFFKSEGIDVVEILENNLIDHSVSLHADMAAVHLGENKLLIDQNQTSLYEKLVQLGADVRFADKTVSGNYPYDIGLNFALFGDFAVGNFRYADITLKNEISDKVKIEVKQGYSKCSILVIGENAIITDDESIYAKTVLNGIDTLLISKGDIMLSGHEYGFIGGASGKISKETIVFFGDIKKHSDFEKITQFILAHNCNFVCTDDGFLRDIGGFISFKEM